MNKPSRLTDLTESTKKYLKQLHHLGWSAEEIAHHTGLNSDSVKEVISSD